MNFRKKKAKVGTNETKVTVGIKRCAECELNLRCSECACLAQKEILLKENKELEIENQSLRGAANSYKLHYNETRAEAVKEFAERLKKRNDDFCVDKSDMAFVVDGIVKEMVGDKE